MSGKKPATKARMHNATIERNPKGDLKAVGGANYDAWNNWVLNSAANTMPPTGNSEEQSVQLDALVSGLISIRPTDPVEGIITAQLLAANQAALWMYRRAWLPEQTFEARTKYLALADKAARTVMMLTERLDHHRGRGQQKIIVQHVTTNNVTADQAVVTESVVTGNAALLTAATDKPMPMIGGTIEPVPAGVGGGVKSK